MCKIFMRFVLVAGALLVSCNLASAADGIVCVGFANYAVRNAKEVRQMGGCGLNLNDVSLSTDRAAQMQWCSSVDEDTVNARFDELRDQTNRCSYCRSYADTMTAAATDNITYGCGFKNAGDQRWRPDNAYHFNGCMAAEDCNNVCVLWDCYRACVHEASVIRQLLDPNIAQVTLAIAQCKATRKSQAPLTASRPIRPAPRETVVVDPWCEPGVERSIVHPCVKPPSTVTSPGQDGRSALIPLTDKAKCGSGDRVPRRAYPGDETCVELWVHDQAIADNLAAASRVKPDGQCAGDYVWREANPRDHVCVTPSTRARTRADNGHFDSARQQPLTPATPSVPPGGAGIPSRVMPGPGSPAAQPTAPVAATRVDVVTRHPNRGAIGRTAAPTTTIRRPSSVYRPATHHPLAHARPSRGRRG
jgi:hypothetical protein